MMAFLSNGLRYAHAEGHTDVCFTDDGSFILTCGNDSDVRTWMGIDDDDPSTNCVGEPAVSIACKNDKIYVGTANNVVQCYSFPSFERLGLPLKFSAPVTDIDVSADGNLLAASSCDMNIKVKDIKSNKITSLTGHSAPVTGVVLDPMVEFLASSSCDGSIKIWDISTGQNVKTFHNLIQKNNDFFTATCYGIPSWESGTGSNIAITNGKKINIYKRNSWEFKFDLVNSDIEKPISVIVFSPCGRYICAATVSGEVIIWNFHDHSILSYIKSPKKVGICAVAWHPSNLQIGYTDKLGHLGLVVQGQDEIEGDDEETAEKELCRVEDFKVSQVKQKDTLNSSDQMEKNSEIEDATILEDLDFDENDDVDKNEGNNVYKDNVDGDDDGDDDDNDDNSISVNKIKAEAWRFSPKTIEEESNDNKASETDNEFSTALQVTSSMQMPFQPSSTSIHFQHRYMVWNSVGIVRCSNYEGEKAIDVEFHDSMFHHPLHMTNTDNYVLASLSDKALCLASHATTENKSKLLCIPFKAWDGNKEWCVEMAENESIIALATSGHWICCATDSNFLRIFTRTGIQRQIVSLPGPVVCLNGHEQLLIIICHIGMGIPQYQKLGYIIFDISDLFIKCITPCQPLPLFPKSTLKWAGFTDEGTPCVYDSGGIVHLSRDHLHWIVGCDTNLQRKSDSDHYFIVGVSEKLQNIRCILCKGSFYPVTLPIPTVVEIPLKLPLCEPDTEKTIQEDIFWRHIFALPVLERLSHTNYEYEDELKNYEKTLKQSSVKMFADACRGGFDMRAYEIATLMSEQPLTLAIKYALKLGKYNFCEKLENLKPKDWNTLCQEEIFQRNKIEYCGIVPEILSDMKKTKNEIKNKIRTKVVTADLFVESQEMNHGNLQNSEKKYNSEFEFQSPVLETIGIPKEDYNSRDLFESQSSSFNPFKVTSKEDNGPKGLDFFNSVQQSYSKASKHEISSSDKINQARSSVSKGSTKHGPKKQTFVDWFLANKPQIQLQHPDMNSSELAKIAMKLYRETNHGIVSSVETEFEKDYITKDLSPEPKRRKTERKSNDNSQKTSIISKLSAFNYMK